MLNLLGQVALVGAVLVPLVGAAVTAIGTRGADWRCRVATGLAWCGGVLALTAVLWVALRGPYGVFVDAGSGRPLVGLWADQLTVTLLALVCVVGAVVQSFSLRYLHGDRAAPRFFAAANVVVAAMAVVCTSVTLALLVVAWVGAGVAFVMVVGSRPDLPGVPAATRRTLRMFAVGDFALVVAMVVVSVRVGNVDLASSFELRTAARQLGGVATLIALLVVVAALTRSAQGPFGRWLPGTVSAPTPTSALLHAGVVNGGGILLIRLAGLTGSSWLVLTGLFTVAALTAVVAPMLMVHRADVKGSLVYSTMGQMGFMVAECAVGAYLAAVAHLMGHALYKATLFFGSGSQVPRAGHLPKGSDQSIPTWWRVVASVATTAAALGVMAGVPGVLTTRGAGVLLLFVGATVATASWSWWRRGPISARWSAVWAASLLIAGVLYGLALAGLGRWISPALPTPGVGALSPWILVGVAGTGLAAAVIARRPAVRRRLVAYLVDAGAPSEEHRGRTFGEGRRGVVAGAPRHVAEPAEQWEESAA